MSHPMNPHGDGPTVRVRGVARVEVVADMGAFAVQVAVFNASRARAHAIAVRRVQRIDGILTRYDAMVRAAEHQSVHTRRATAEEVAALPVAARSQPAVWVAITRIDVRALRHPALTGLLETLESSRLGVQVSAPTWTLRPDHPVLEASRRQAVREAMAAGRVMAEALDTTVRDLEWVIDDPGVQVLACAGDEHVVEASVLAQFRLLHSPMTRPRAS